MFPPRFNNESNNLINSSLYASPMLLNNPTDTIMRIWIPILKVHEDLVSATNEHIKQTRVQY